MRHCINYSSHGELRAQQAGREGRNSSESDKVLGGIGAPLHETGSEGTLWVDGIVRYHQGHNQTAALVSYEADNESQHDGQGDRLAGVATLFSSCRNYVKTNECVEAGSCTSEHL